MGCCPRPVLLESYIKSKSALFLAAFLGGVFVDGITTWKEFWFLNMWQAGPCPAPSVPGGGGGNGPRPAHGGFNFTTGNLTVSELYPHNMTVVWPSAPVLNVLLSLGAQSVSLVVNQMVRLHALHRNAARDGFCNATMCTFTATDLYADSSYKFTYSMLGLGDGTQFTGSLHVLTPPV